METRRMLVVVAWTIAGIGVSYLIGQAMIWTANPHLRCAYFSLLLLGYVAGITELRMGRRTLWYLLTVWPCVFLFLMAFTSFASPSSIKESLRNEPATHQILVLIGSVLTSVVLIPADFHQRLRTQQATEKPPTTL